MLDTTILRRKAHPIRYEAAAHLFTIGQIVRLKDAFKLQPESAADYRITAMLPPRGDSLQYRIRNADELCERVATQQSLEPAPAPAPAMDAGSGETAPDRPALAISVWENEGGAQAPNLPDDQFGRRVETDRSWTVYHVFTGIPARIDGGR